MDENGDQLCMTPLPVTASFALMSDHEHITYTIDLARHLGYASTIFSNHFNWYNMKTTFERQFQTLHPIDLNNYPKTPLIFLWMLSLSHQPRGSGDCGKSTRCETITPSIRWHPVETREPISKTRTNTLMHVFREGT